MRPFDPRLALLCAGLLATACRGTSPNTLPEDPPMDVEGRYSSTFDYLLARHDGDGDGEITEGEYQRSEAGFERLDRNGDGVVSAADWQRRSRDGRNEDGSAMDRMRRMRATGMVAMYFQRNEPGTVTVEELQASADEYDTDHDGKVSAAEFTCASEGRKVELPGSMGRSMARMSNTTPWEAMVGAVDENEDGLLARSEFAAFFVAADGNDDGVWTFDQAPPLSSNRDRASGTSDRPQAPAVGVVAPDFTLTPPEGGKAVTLSGFAGTKPVALIFGSYT